MEVIYFKGKLRVVIIIAVIICVSLVFGYNQLYSEYMLDDKYDNVLRLKQYENKDVIRVCKALNTVNGNQEVVQVARVKVYKGIIKLMTTIDVDSNKLTDTKVLKHSETEAYGGYITEKWFTDRFKSKKADRQLKTVKVISEDSSEIVAVTGATISSEAVVSGVNLTLENYMKMSK